MTRLTPSSSLCSYVRLKWGPLQLATAAIVAQAPTVERTTAGTCEGNMRAAP
jgi:hypothetical protein